MILNVLNKKKLFIYFSTNRIKSNLGFRSYFIPDFCSKNKNAFSLQSMELILIRPIQKRIINKGIF